jgi:hypothetical protein
MRKKGERKSIQNMTFLSKQLNLVSSYNMEVQTKPIMFVRKRNAKQQSRHSKQGKK